LNKTIITSEPTSFWDYLVKIWQYRNFILTLAKRDLKIKYAQTALGVAWSIVQPLVAVVVFTLFFGVLLSLETPYPYLLFVLSGVVCWNFFNYIFSHGSTSLMNNQELIRKLSFPKIILPISKVLVAMIEFVFTLLLMIPVFIYHQIELSLTMFFFPVVIFFILVFSLGLSLILAASTLRFRDLHHIIPFLVNFGIWFTPVFYPVSLIPGQYKDFIYLNPMASLIGLARWSLFGGSISYMALIGVLISVMILLIGVIYFKRVEDRVTEII
jgi:lipopolysaccharide transport system permease protein